MKLKRWLQEYRNMSYAEYKTLPEVEQEVLQCDHREFCRKEQIHARQNWCPMTMEEEIIRHCIIDIKENREYT